MAVFDLMNPLQSQGRHQAYSVCGFQLKLGCGCYCAIYNAHQGLYNQLWLQRIVAGKTSISTATGHVFLQSDVEDVTAAMRDEFEMFGAQNFCLANEHLSQSTLSHSSLTASPGTPPNEEQNSASNEQDELLPGRTRLRERIKMVLDPRCISTAKCRRCRPSFSTKLDQRPSLLCCGT